MRSCVYTVCIFPASPYMKRHANLAPALQFCAILLILACIVTATLCLLFSLAAQP